MKRFWPITAGVLAVLLLLSNGFWLMRMYDLTILFATRDRQYSEACQALKQALAALPLMAAGRARDEVLAAARNSAPDDEPFEKDGAHWVGWLGFELGEQGQLRRVLPSWEPFDCE
jgi:hypothetical protein